MLKRIALFLFVWSGAESALAQMSELDALCYVKEDPPIITDFERKVHTFSKILERSLPGVIQVLRLQNSRPHLAGAGVILDAQNGYIVTNHHVIENVGAEDLRIVLRDRRVFNIKVIGVDPEVDLAFLQLIPANNVKVPDLSEIPFGNSDCLKIGDMVMAIGHPGERDYTVTSGIISALGRELEGIPLTYQDFIQTDADINEGNSGGALINTKGELIGINTAVSSWLTGVGFAIPSNMIQTLLTQFLNYNETRRSGIGIWSEMSSSDDPLENRFSSMTFNKVVVVHVNNDSPAQEAGLQEQDVLLAVNGQPVHTDTHLYSKLRVQESGTLIKITYYRPETQETKTVDVQLELKQEIFLLGENMTPNLSGAIFTIMQPSVRLTSLGHPIDSIYIPVVRRDSPAWNSGLRAQDYILSFNPTLSSRAYHSVEYLVAFKKLLTSLNTSIRMIKEDVEHTIPIEPKEMYFFLLRDRQTLMLKVSLNHVS